MNILIVFAHPEPRSFCGALKDVAVETLAGLGHQVSVSDLYGQSFQPVGGRADFDHPSADGPFNYQAEQRRAYETASYEADLAAEQEKVRAADLIMLNFPLWWFGAPAILKGWIDRVMSVGFAYDSDRRFDKGGLRGRKGMVTVTTGSPSERFTSDGGHAYASMEHTLLPFQRGLFPYVGMEALPPFVAFAVARVPDDTRRSYLDEYCNHLARTVGPA